MQISGVVFESRCKLTVRKLLKDNTLELSIDTVWCETVSIKKSYRRVSE